MAAGVPLAYKIPSAPAKISVTETKPQARSYPSGPPQKQPDCRTETVAKLSEAIVDLNLVGHAASLLSPAQHQEAPELLVQVREPESADAHQPKQSQQSS